MGPSSWGRKESDTTEATWHARMPCNVLGPLKCKVKRKGLLLSVHQVPNLISDFACIFLFCPQGTLMRYLVCLQKIRLRLQEVKQWTQGHTARRSGAGAGGCAGWLRKPSSLLQQLPDPPRTGYQSFLIIIAIIIIIGLFNLNIIWNTIYIQTSVFFRVQLNEFS